MAPNIGEAQYAISSLHLALERATMALRAFQSAEADSERDDDLVSDTYQALLEAQQDCSHWAGRLGSAIL